MSTVRIIATLFITATLGAALSSCVKSDEAHSGAQIVVRLSDADATRAQSIEDANGLKGHQFGFAASRTPAGTAVPQAYFSTQAAVGNDLGVTLSEPRYWPVNPGDQLKFFSWYPFYGNDIPAGVALPTVNMTTPGEITIIHRAEALAEKQIDVMAAVSSPAHGAAVPVHFYHTLTKVSFGFRKENSGMRPIPLIKVELRNVNTAGSLTVDGIPDYTEPATPEFTWIGTSRGNVSFTAPPNTMINSVKAEALGEEFLLLPDLSFSNEAAIVLTLYSDGADGQTVTLPLKDIPTPHTWKSGEHVHYIITVKDPGVEIFAVPLAWEEKEYNKEIFDPRRWLNVSQTSVSINQMTAARITFSTNKRHVWIADQMTSATDNNTDVNMRFTGILAMAYTQEKPPLLHYSYDQGTGITTGYVDILSQSTPTNGDVDYHTAPHTDNYILKLCAADNIDAVDGSQTPTDNAVVRNIAVQVTYTWNLSVFNAYNTVGVFFRKNETGERIVSNFGRNTLGDGAGTRRKWTATVDEDSRSWIKITNIPSFDPGLGSDAAGDPEKYPVVLADWETGTTATGVGRVYFRVGAKTPNSETYPRYGKITVTVSNAGEPTAIDQSLTQTIYVRQGEQADYLMHPDEDGLPTGETAYPASNGRAAAKPVAPYNLTAKKWMDGENGTALADYSYRYASAETESNYFTKYPSQVGAHMLWGYGADRGVTKGNDRTLFAPGTPVTMTSWHGSLPASDGLSYSMSGSERYFQPDMDACPYGYHRPKDGPQGQVVNPDNATQMQQSEIRLSLFKRVPLGTLSNSGTMRNQNDDNVYYGVLADGYFDRGARSGNNSNLVKAGTNQVASVGALFYNTRNNASVFLPATGWREVTSVSNTSTLNDLSSGYYWTAGWFSTGNNSPYRHGGTFLQIKKPDSKTSISQFYYQNNYQGMAVRCVKN